MEFDNLSFNWRSTDDEYAESKYKLEILTASGSLLGELTSRSHFIINTSRISFDYDVEANLILANAEALDTYTAYWLLSLEDGTLTKIPPSSLEVIIEGASLEGNGFELSLIHISEPTRPY